MYEHLMSRDKLRQIVAAQLRTVAFDIRDLTPLGDRATIIKQIVATNLRRSSIPGPTPTTFLELWQQVEPLLAQDQEKK